MLMTNQPSKKLGPQNLVITYDENQLESSRPVHSMEKILLKTSGITTPQAGGSRLQNVNANVPMGNLGQSKQTPSYSNPSPVKDFQKKSSREDQQQRISRFNYPSAFYSMKKHILNKKKIAPSLGTAQLENFEELKKEIYPSQQQQQYHLVSNNAE